MISLVCNTAVRKVPALSKYAESFPVPIVSFLQSDERDVRGVFPTVVFTDFKNGEIRYVQTLSQANSDALDAADPERKRFALIKGGNDPHGIVKTGEDRFLLTFQDAKFILDFDTAAGTYDILESDDLFDVPLDNVRFGATFFKSPEKSPNGKERFYLTRAGRSRETFDYVSECYSCDVDFSERRFVSRSVSEYLIRPPHVAKELDGIVFHSSFFDAGFKIPSIGKVCPTKMQFIDKVYSDFERLYRRTPAGKSDASAKLYELPSGNVVSDGFRDFIEALKKNVGADDLFELVRKVLYEVEVLPGSFRTIDTKTGTNSLHQASAVATGHFEFDEKRKRAFVSCHNFDPNMRGGSISYFGPAVIDRFDLGANGELTKAGSFSHPTGFRFTSHRVFEFGGKSHVCVVWHPSRLFFFDADTMELEFLSDVFPNSLDDFQGEALKKYVKTAGLWPNSPFLRPVEVSHDGKYAYLPGIAESYLFDFSLAKIREIVPPPETGAYREVDVERFFKLGAHCQRFE